MKKYLYCKNKPGRKVHLQKPGGGTWCKLENSRAWQRIDAESDELPIHPEFNKPRKVCGICRQKSGEAIPLPASKPKRRKRKAGRKKTRKDGFYQSWEWKRARYETLKRYGRECMCCGATHSVVVDHIKPRRKYPDLELDPENLQVLCNDCNMGKGAWDETDWRPDARRRKEEIEAELDLEHLNDLREKGFH